MADYDTSKFNLAFPNYGGGRKTWVYEDTGPVTDVVAAGFVTDGADKGCDSGDLVMYTDTSRGKVYGLRVSAITDTGVHQVTLDGQVTIGDTS
jgi:hypothetical protein